MTNGSGNSIRILILLTIVIGTLIVTPAAQAQTNPAFSGVTATAENATTAYSNPAGLTRIDHTQIVGLVSIVYGESDFKVKSGTTGGGFGTINNDGWIAIPQFYLSVPFKENWPARSRSRFLFPWLRISTSPCRCTVSSFTRGGTLIS